ncbi:MAG: urease subunit alpha [Gaiellaceae bacterium]
MDRATYAALYGPTSGDRLRLGDTNLWLEVEADDTAPGWEPVIGFGKTIRHGQLMSPEVAPEDALDVVVANVVLLDPLSGVRKTSIGIKDGRIVGVGRAGDPDRDSDVAVPISPWTGVVPGEGLIATAGAIDTHVHLISPELAPAALSGGVTTVVAMGYGGAFDLGIGPRTNFERLLAAWEAVPLNLLPLARASTTNQEHLRDALAWGAAGFKTHEDLGAYPEIVDATLAVCDEQDVQLALHLDGLGESASLDETLAAIDARTVHLFHIEGCGGGPANLLEASSLANVLPSSTNPTIPFGVGAVAEHEAMIATVHRLQASLENDRLAASERIRPWTMAAESVLHDLGAISMTSSDSMGMGRIGETTRRTWQLAHVMKAGAENKNDNDNDRILRYLAKLTINPALTHGIAHDVGSLEPGKSADIVLWRPSFFGVKPQLVLKAGFAAWGSLGSASASTRIGEPVVQQGFWGAKGSAPTRLATVYSSALGETAAAAQWPGRVARVRECRAVRKEHMVRNGATPKVEVDPQEQTVRVDGARAELEPAAELPLNRAYLLS